MDGRKKRQDRKRKDGFGDRNGSGREVRGECRRAAVEQTVKRSWEVKGEKGTFNI